MSSKHQIAHSLNDRHRHVERSIRRVNVSQGNHDGQRVIVRGGGGGGAKIVKKMRFINPTF